jgi:hypothetical protein
MGKDEYAVIKSMHNTVVLNTLGIDNLDAHGAHNFDADPAGGTGTGYQTLLYATILRDNTTDYFVSQFDISTTGQLKYCALVNSVDGFQTNPNVPGFVDSSNGDFHILENSQIHDWAPIPAGENYPSTDFDGTDSASHPRQDDHPDIPNGDGVGDIGADEDRDG